MRACVAVVLPFSLLLGCGSVRQQDVSQPIVSVNSTSEREVQRTLYEEIFWRYQDDDSLFNEALRKRITDYVDFLKQYPESEFAPETRLRIAEFLQLLGKKEAALPWLNTIIAKYPDDSYYSLVKRDYTGDKTSGWALYWRAVWFKGKTAREDLERIVRENLPDSKVVRDAQFELEKYKERK